VTRYILSLDGIVKGYIQGNWLVFGGCRYEARVKVRVGWHQRECWWIVGKYRSGEVIGKLVSEFGWYLRRVCSRYLAGLEKCDMLQSRSR
jgi:hypothetical protein